MHPAGSAAAGTPRQPSKRRIPVSHLGMADPHQLFDDTSSAQSQGYGAQRGPSGLGYPTASASPQAAFLADPVSNMAMAYGSSLAAQGKELVDKNIDRFIPVTKLKYYFAVDTLYVGKKLGLLFFPYLHQDWEVQYQQDTPVAPRFDVNAPDLYIPAMAFITYVLVAGLALGTQDRFSPDLLGLQASSALAWLTLEVLAILLSLYLVTVNTDLTTIDLVAFLGYKYVGMIGGILMGLLFGKIGYYLVLGWCCMSIFVFMGVLNPEEKCLLVTGCSQHIGVLHQMFLIVPGAPDSAEGALLVPPCHSDQADHGGSQQEDEDHHEQPRQDHH